MFWRYNLLYVYIRKYESGGLMWPFVYMRIIITLAIGFFFTGCVFISKEAYAQVRGAWGPCLPWGMGALLAIHRAWGCCLPWGMGVLLAMGHGGPACHGAWGCCLPWGMGALLVVSLLPSPRAPVSVPPSSLTRTPWQCLTCGPRGSVDMQTPWQCLTCGPRGSVRHVGRAQ